MCSMDDPSSLTEKRDVPLPTEQLPSEKPQSTNAGEVDGSDQMAHWRESFIRQAGSGGSSRLVVWLVVGLVLIIVLLFVFSA